MATIQDLCLNALREIGVAGAEETSAASGDANFALSKLNRLFDAWAAQRKYVYAVKFTTFTIVPNTAPLTIGPTGANFTMSPRPVKIVSAGLVLAGSSPIVSTSLKLHHGPAGAAWWARQTVPTITGVPTDLYYSPGWPNGSLYLWPVPTEAHGLSLETWNQVSAAVALADTFSFPPGYEDAITQTLAESMWAAFHGSEAVPAHVTLAAAKARSVIASPNLDPPQMNLRSRSLEGGRNSGTFNYSTGEPA